MRTHLKTALLALAVAGLAACGGGDDKKPAGGGSGAKPAAGGDAKPAAGGYNAATATASVKGKVKWTGAKPAQAAVVMSSDPVCQKHPSVNNPAQDVAADGGLPNCFVWAHKGPHEGMSGLPEPAAVTLDQMGCMYAPRVFGVKVNAPITIKNSDGTKHNVHIRSKATPDYNHAQGPNETDSHKLVAKEKAISINCDIHTWMQAWAFVMEHPFFAVTKADGTFEVGNLPAGTYKFKVWHEAFSGDKAVESEFDITVKDGEAATKDVELK